MWLAKDDSLRAPRGGYAASIAPGDVFATGGKVAHGDLAGAGGAGGLAMRTGFSWAALLRTNPFPDGRPPDFGTGVLVVPGGAGEDGLSSATLLLTSGVGSAARAAVSSG